MNDVSENTKAVPFPAALGGLVFAVAFGVYLLTAHGAVRSPDAEIQFRAAQAVWTSGTLRPEAPLESWPGFGLAEGWPVFGPLQPLLAAPLAGFGESLAPTLVARWPWPLPPSHYTGDTLVLLSWGEHPGAPSPDARARAPETIAAIRIEDHGARMAAALLFGPLCGALAAFAFFGAALALGASCRAAWLGALLFAFATLQWPYSGTFFSEPLAAAALTASLWAIVAARGPAANAVSGLLLGLAVAAHVSAILFAPFFLAYALWTGRPGQHARLVPALGFLAGLALPLLLLAAWNLVRFGSPFETGRAADAAAAAAYGYGQWRWPGLNLPALLLSPANGLLWLCPVIVLGAWGWVKLLRRCPALAWMILAAACFRLLFIASRTDWHGGFALGPRYLVLLLPLVLLPATLLFDAPRRTAAIAWLAGCAAVFLQWLFVLGEPFLALHRVRWTAQLTGQVDDLDGRLHVTAFPATGFWPRPREIEGVSMYWPEAWGPFWLQGAAMAWWLPWLGGCLVIAVLWTAAWIWRPGADGPELTPPGTRQGRA